MSLPSPATPEPKSSPGTEQEINWGDYRDHLATAHKDGSRKWVYAKKPCGTWTARRKWFAWVLIATMFAGPFVKIGGNPLLMINIVERKFSILGQIFWPEDSIIFAVTPLQRRQTVAGCQPDCLASDSTLASRTCLPRVLTDGGGSIHMSTCSMSCSHS